MIRVTYFPVTPKSGFHAMERTVTLGNFSDELTVRDLATEKLQVVSRCLARSLCVERIEEAAGLVVHAVAAAVEEMKGDWEVNQVQLTWAETASEEFGEEGRELSMVAVSVMAWDGRKHVHGSGRSEIESEVWL